MLDRQAYAGACGRAARLRMPPQNSKISRRAWNGHTSGVF